MWEKKSFCKIKEIVTKSLTKISNRVIYQLKSAGRKLNDIFSHTISRVKEFAWNSSECSGTGGQNFSFDLLS